MQPTSFPLITVEASTYSWNRGMNTHHEQPSLTKPGGVRLVRPGLKSIHSPVLSQVSQANSSHLHEGEDEAHSEVGNPVQWPSNYVGCWAVGLFKQLCSDQEGDPRWNTSSLMSMKLLDKAVWDWLNIQSRINKHHKAKALCSRWHSKSHVCSMFDVVYVHNMTGLIKHETFSIYFIYEQIMYDMEIIQDLFSSQQQGSSQTNYRSKATKTWMRITCTKEFMLAASSVIFPWSSLKTHLFVYYKEKWTLFTRNAELHILK